MGTEWAVAGGLLLAAAGVLAVGAELFAEHAASAGRQLGVSGLAVGLLLAGAEPEELVTAVLAAVRDQPGIAAGDAIGANVTLLTLVTGGLALIAPVDVGGRGLRYVMAALVATVAAWGVCVDHVEAARVVPREPHVDGRIVGNPHVTANS